MAEVMERECSALGGLFHALISDMKSADCYDRRSGFSVVLGILLACCLVVIIILLLTRNKKQVCEYCKGTLGASHSVPHDSVIQDPQDGETDSLNYAALEFSGRKTRGRKKNSERTQESLYSAVPARGDGRTRQLIGELRLAANKLRPAQDTDFMDSEEGSVGGDRDCTE
ncbi:unnamed protein product [Arctogadus glacialis]